MNVRIMLVAFASLFSLFPPARADIFETLGLKQSADQGAPGIYIGTGVAADKQPVLDALKRDRAQIQEEEQKFSDDAAAHLEKIVARIDRLNKRLAGAQDATYDFVQQLLALAKETRHVLKELPVARKQMIGWVDQHIKLLEEYLKDPEFKSLALEPRSFYSFEEFQQVSKKLGDLDDKITLLEEQKNNTKSELQNREKDSAAHAKSVKEKKKEQDDLGAILEPATSAEGELTLRQRGEIVDAELKLAQAQKEYAALQEEGTRRKSALLEFRLVIAKEQRKLFAAQLSEVKSSYRVDEQEVQHAREALEIARQAYSSKKDMLYSTRERLTAEREELKKELTTWAAQAKLAVGDVEDFDEISMQTDTVEAYVAWAHLVQVKQQVLGVDKHIDLANAELGHATRELNYAKENALVIDSWHKITLQKFTSEEELAAELKQYEGSVQALERDLSAVKEKRVSATNFLKMQNKATSAIKQRAQEIEEQKGSLFRGHARDFEQCLALIEKSQRAIAEQAELNGKLMELYSSTIDIIANTQQLIGAIVGELKSLGIWYRSVSAITWRGLKAFFDDFSVFVGRMYRFAQMRGVPLVGTVRQANFGELAWVMGIILALILLFFALRRAVAALGELIKRAAGDPDDRGFVVLKLADFLVTFIRSYFVWLFIWLACFLFAHYHPDWLSYYPEWAFLKSFLYLFSIPYFVFLVWQFVRMLRVTNAQNEYVFFSRSSERRIITLLSIVGYATVIILFLREAFLLVQYGKSEFPTILFALYSIIIRVSLVASIRKEDITDLLPTRIAFFGWLREQVDRYYPLVMCVLFLIIVLSEPHVGFGRLISYFVWGIIGTALLIPLLIAAHTFVKKTSAQLFFIYDEDTVRERFAAAKSWYGVFVICGFLFFVGVGIAISAMIWGYTISWGAIYDTLNEFPGWVIGHGKEATTISILSLLKLLGFIGGSFILASAINRFVLGRVFELLLVGSGVQYTVSRIIHYVVIVLAVFIGLSKVGFGFLLPYLTTTIFIGLGWSMKDHVNDFISYFIILVQRPFQIGDFIRLDDQISGVVRRITPRAVILRSKNSVTVLVPNARIVGGVIKNWSYSPTFTAFDDIKLQVGYAANPRRVKDLLLEAVEKNENVLRNPRPIIRLQDFSENGYEFMVRAFIDTSNVLKQWNIASQVRKDIVDVFRRENVQFAFPIRVVQLRSHGGGNAKLRIVRKNNNPPGQQGPPPEGQ